MTGATDKHADIYANMFTQVLHQAHKFKRDSFFHPLPFILSFQVLETTFCFYANSAVQKKHAFMIIIQNYSLANLKFQGGF